MKKYLLLVLFLGLLSTNCSSPTESEGTRIGAVCKDGTRSSATGSGACSSHGGVDYWLYK